MGSSKVGRVRIVKFSPVFVASGPVQNHGLVRVLAECGVRPMHPWVAKRGEDVERRTETGSGVGVGESQSRQSFEHDPSSAGSSPTDAQPRAELANGSGLGKYRVLECIRRTDRAVVYKARDTLLDRLVGLKRMSPGLIDDPVACGEFRREAQMMARCGRSSPHVIGIHELIGDDRGLFIVQDSLDGRWLDTLISKRQLTAKQILRTFGTIALGLRAIHRFGIVHRDIRPSNIVFAPKVGAIIADLSSAAPEGDCGMPSLPTAKYAAPELLRGCDYDDRVDIYSLGMILFEMCVGSAQLDRHFAEHLSDPNQADDLWKAWHTDYEKALPPASELNPSVPPALSAIIGQTTAKNLDERYSSIDELTAALARLLESRRRNATHRLTDPMPISQVSGMPVYATAQLPTIAARPARFRDASFPLSAMNRETTTHPVALPENARRRVATPAPEVAESPAVPPTTRVKAKQVRVCRQLVPKRRRQTVPAESIPTPEPVEENPRAEGGRRWVIAVAASIMFIAVVLAGAIGWYKYWGPGAVHQIQQIFAEGLAAYDDHRFVLAREKFMRAARTPVSGRFSAVRGKAERWVLLSEAQEALNQENYPRVLERLAIAENRGADTAQVDAIRRLLESHTRRRELVAQIERAVAQGDTANLDAKLAVLRNTSALESADSAALRNRIVQSKARERYRGQIESARAALDEGEFAAALLACREAQSISDTVEVRDLVQRIKTFKTRDEWLRRGDAAMIDKRHEVAVEAYDRANQLSPDSEIEEKAGVARAHVLFDEAERAMEDGDLLLAERKLKNSLWQHFLPKASSKLRAWTPAFEAARLALRADRAAKSGEYGRAIELYNSALPQLPAPADAVVRAKVATAERNAARARGDAANKHGN